MRLYNLISFLIINLGIYAQDVPPVYEDLYESLEQELITSDALISEVWNGDPYCSDYLIDLNYANTTRMKSRLLEPFVLQKSKAAIEALATLGVKGIRVHAGYPFLVESFPQSDDYLQFFQEVVSHAKEHGLKVYVKSAITPNNPLYGAVDPVVFAFMEGKTRSEYVEEKSQVLQTILDELDPAYLTMEDEPTSMEKASGLSFGFSPEEVKEMLTHYTSKLENPENVPLGAGAGSWEGLEYFTAIAEVPGIDYVGIHVFPVVLDYFGMELIDICETIKELGKTVAFTECWLYKQSVEDIQNKVPPVELFKRDHFQFWETLDIKFAEVLSKFAQEYKANMVTLYRTDNMFHYLEYTPGLEDSSGAYLGSLIFQPVNQNILQKNFTRMALSYKEIQDAACITSKIIKTRDLEGEVQMFVDKEVLHVQAPEIIDRVYIYDFAGRLLVNHTPASDHLRIHLPNDPDLSVKIVVLKANNRYYYQKILL